MVGLASWGVNVGIYNNAIHVPSVRSQQTIPLGWTLETARQETAGDRHGPGYCMRTRILSRHRCGLKMVRFGLVTWSGFCSGLVWFGLGSVADGGPRPVRPLSPLIYSRRWPDPLASLHGEHFAAVAFVSWRWRVVCRVRCVCQQRIAILRSCALHCSYVGSRIYWRASRLCLWLAPHRRPAAALVYSATVTSRRRKPPPGLHSPPRKHG